MRGGIYFIVFALLSSLAAASWDTYQNSLGNSGSTDETGNFPADTADYSDNSLGMDFQPLVEDLDANKSKEITIFSNGSLIIFNKKLNILSQLKVGALLGQPTLFDFDNDKKFEIIFNARQGSQDYFFAYEYSERLLRQEFNISLPRDANFSGIKCLKLNNTPICVFKDKQNYVHIVDLDARNDSSYNTSAHDEAFYTVPAIGDIHNNGHTQAVFWFDRDSSSGYGFLVFDLNERKPDSNFNGNGIVDKIFDAVTLSPTVKLYKIIGQPVLVDLDNDKKLEIAVSVFYDDKALIQNGDWFTELFVYASNGTKIFSKCEKPTAINAGCNDGSGANDRWEGTNPFIMDYNKNGMDDVCFIKDVKNKIGSIAFSHMALACYDYNGLILTETNITGIQDGAKGTAMTADLNNDGKMDIITAAKSYYNNGTSLFNYGLYTFNPVAVDIDGNEGVDFIWTKGSQTKVFLDGKDYNKDLAVSSIDFLKHDKAHVNVSVTFSNAEIALGNVKAVIYNKNTLENGTFAFNLSKNNGINVSALISVKDGDTIIANIDFDNEIEEDDESNNVMEKEFVELPYVYVSSDVGISLINNEIEDYIKNNLVDGYFARNEFEADVFVYIGKNNPRNQDERSSILNDYGFGYDYGSIIYLDETASNPYAALVASFESNYLLASSRRVMIAGNDIEGDIAGVKEIVKNQALFLRTQSIESTFIDDENIDAVKVYDYLHTDGNYENYKFNNDAFKTIVRNAMDERMFSIKDKNVTTSSGINLRLRNMNPNLSSDYRDYLNSNGMPTNIPVVLAHGLFSNLTTWEELGAEISNTGRDTWLIEITGGPGQDCDDCIDYSYYNLTDEFVPALLNGVLTFTGKHEIQYVGFSNGCRSALDSLERGKFDSSKVETFVAVGCPGSFEGNSTLGKIVFSKNGEISRKLESIGRTHYTFETIAIAGLFNKEFIPKEG